jgi:hypothetical protein
MGVRGKKKQVFKKVLNKKLKNKKEVDDEGF